MTTMSQVDTVTTPIFLTLLTTGAHEVFKCYVEDEYLLRKDSEYGLLLSSPEVAATHTNTAKWAASCRISTDTINKMKAPFLYKGQVEQTWNKISQALSLEALHEVMRDYKDKPGSIFEESPSFWKLTVNTIDQERSQKMWFNVDVTCHTGNYLASGVDLLVVDQDASCFRYGYRPDTHLLVEGRQKPSKTHYRFDAKPHLQQRLYPKNPTAE